MITEDRIDGQSPFEVLERDRRKRLLIATSLTVAVATSVLDIIYLALFILQSDLDYLFSVGQCTLAVVISLIARHMANRNRPDVGSIILLSFLILSAASGGLALGGAAGELALSYVIVIVLGSTLLGAPGDFIITTVISLLWLGQLAIDLFGPTSAYSDTGFPVTIVVLPLAVFIFTTLINRATIRTVQRALGDATYELIQANRQLVEASNLKSQFMARMSHELRTPLNAIVGYTDLALRNIYGNLNEDLKDSQTRVLRNARRLETLINDLLDLSKIEAGQLKLVEVTFPVKNLIEAVQVSLAPRASNKGLQFRATLAPDMPSHIVGDETRLTQIVTNLVDNAIKFTDHGSVSVLIEPMEDEKWRIEVRDTGRGIREEDYEHIFDEFRQISPSSEARSGTGLGLAIAQHLARMMGGKIRVQSQIGKGSLFEVISPLQVADEVHVTIQ